MSGRLDRWSDSSRERAAVLTNMPGNYSTEIKRFLFLFEAEAAYKGYPRQTVAIGGILRTTIAGGNVLLSKPERRAPANIPIIARNCMKVVGFASHLDKLGCNW